ncbi:hypothetical protein MNBD_GAMMA03-2132 [hydrothermal vent metagenome]|uniref:Uncharacterized protein n=1 Tax=hydrothermal vent metagenome TaxID=652676 RepID=A0A3B0WYH3_9ZZZZ
MNDLANIVSLIQGERVALVGNSRKVLGQQFDVDRYDVVIRMNDAWKLPEEMKQSVGTRLDLLCVSGKKTKIEKLAEKEFLVMWMSPKNRDMISKSTCDNIEFYPLDWWQELYEILDARPSTGCMAVDTVRRLIGDGTLTLYGFDFFQNDSWHKTYSFKEKVKRFLGMNIYVNPHDGEKEAQFIQKCLPTSQLTIVLP